MKAVATLRLLHTNSAISHLQLSRLLDLYERRWAKLITGNTYVRSYVWHTIICRRNDARGVNPVLVWVRQYDNFVCVTKISTVTVVCCSKIIMLNPKSSTPAFKTGSQSASARLQTFTHYKNALRHKCLSTRTHAQLAINFERPLPYKVPPYPTSRH